jgi:isochorismate synthase
MMPASTSVSSSTLTDTDYFSRLINYALQNKFSLALWRLPQDRVTRLAISKNPHLLKYTAALEELEAGFIFAPFDAASERVFLRADIAFSFSDGMLNAPETPLEVASHSWLAEEGRLLKKLKQAPYTTQSSGAEASKKDFMKMVEEALGAIESGTFEKVVLSRKKIIHCSNDLDIPVAFQKLCSLYSNALISFVTIPDAGSWLGASPELLVSLQDKRIFKTTALAGTQAYSHGVDIKTVAWTQKDIEEQALVERYIISCFKKIRLREYEEHGPRTVVAGNLIHLKSDFMVDMQATNFPRLGSVMLQLLHPTSAVCGVPLDTALEFIHKHENYPRQFYTGYLGPVNFLNRTDIFVNLRCLQFLQEKLILYAGAGITQDSIPDKEWEETELKLSTLLKVLQ